MKETPLPFVVWATITRLIFTPRAQSEPLDYLLHVVALDLAHRPAEILHWRPSAPREDIIRRAIELEMVVVKDRGEVSSLWKPANAAASRSAPHRSPVAQDHVGVW